MEIVSLLVVIAMLLALCFVVAFVWASKRGQFDDLDTPAYLSLIHI